ncbi:uncharacterized protein BT62DRAFT_387469 [Guyanagaster necrorhizus]|uniref:Uncharacterized protein n=1 Tax=Guyanagaster necrorhizus TaxID=856835 RepID=A0A9P8AX11_9AGAR|nr:uncharacterized protein BT62DRAFT_387469 [Guyanagaster necrorhizus MCA 3950]KAG7450935.1 hypothetical protein BT62DRAFT_387469 [Guyanagaster necrorhizus MCA 3950]
MCKSIKEQLSIMGLLFGNTGEQLEELTEVRFLMMSWWLLHVGWKVVGERVRTNMEDFFEGVSLKTRLMLWDLHRLVLDVQRQIDLSAEYVSVFCQCYSTAKWLVLSLRAFS